MSLSNPKNQFFISIEKLQEVILDIEAIKTGDFILID